MTTTCESPSLVGRAAPAVLQFFDSRRSPLAVARAAEIDSLLAQDAVVAIGVSGGKDSSAVALRMAAYLDEIGHRGPRVLIHSDLGSVEWSDSLPTCERLATRLGMELMVVRRKGGGLMERWEQRWRDNVGRYARLDCVRLILPWSTPRARFCTSEGKAQPIASALRKRWPSGPIISVLGIRAAESAPRARMPVAGPDVRLTRAKGAGVVWRAIHHWTTPDVFRYLAEVGETLHEAYTTYGSSRLSCTFCIMGSDSDLAAAARCEANAGIYRRMVALESRSSFAFQGQRWLADVVPHLLAGAAREASARARIVARLRVRAEERIPPDLLFQSGWPVRAPTMAEAQVLAEVRSEVADLCQLEGIGYTSAAAVVSRFEELIEAKRGRAPEPQAVEMQSTELFA